MLLKPILRLFNKLGLNVWSQLPRIKLLVLGFR